MNLRPLAWALLIGAPVWALAFIVVTVVAR